MLSEIGFEYFCIIGRLFCLLYYSVGVKNPKKSDKRMAAGKTAKETFL